MKKRFGAIPLLFIILILLLVLVSTAFAMSSEELLKYKNQAVTVVEYSNVIPYTETGIVLDIVISDNKTYLLLKTIDGIRFINIESILKIL